MSEFFVAKDENKVYFASPSEPTIKVVDLVSREQAIKAKERLLLGKAYWRKITDPSYLDDLRTLAHWAIIELSTKTPAK